MLLEGAQIGRYHLLRLIGSGGMGEVYLAEDPTIRRQVAIKVLRIDTPSSAERASDSEGIRLFLREARAVAQLDHPHILPLFDYGEERVQGASLAFLVMPYRSEGSLLQWIEQHDHAAAFSPQELISIVQQAADALQYAHNHNVIHQDVKPSNFLIRSATDNTGSAQRLDILLADFGVAKISTATTSNSQGIRGTPKYMAPEQWNGEAVPASDQYALAIMVYELLTGRTPFTGTPLQLMYQHIHTPPPAPSTQNPRLSSTIDQVILRTLAKRPEERFSSITAFAQALCQALQNTSVGETPTIDLRATLAISKEEAQRGTSRTLALPGGRRISVSIPPNAQDGQVLLVDSPSDPSSQEKQALLRLTLSIQETEALPLTPGESNLVETALLHSSHSEASTPVQISDASTLVKPEANPISDASTIKQPEPISISDASTRVISNPAPVSDASAVVVSDPSPVTPAERAIPVSVPSAPRRSQKKGLWFITAALLIILAGAGIFALPLLNSKTVQHPLLTATQTQVKTTPIVHTTPSPTPTPNLTATTSAANPNPYPPHNGTMTMNDPLTNNSRGYGWDNYPTDASGSACQFGSDGYHVLQLQQNINSCLSQVQPASFAFEVQMHIARGDCGGIIFRSDINSSKDYTFEVCQDGSYNLYLDLNTSTTTLLSKSSAAIQPGHSATNTIAVVANGSSLSFYVNHTNIANITDSTYGKGYIGMIAEDMNGPTEAIYRNAKLWTF